MNITSIVQLGLSVFLLSSSIVLMLIALILYGIKMSPVRKLMFLGMLAFSSSLWFFIRNPFFESMFQEKPIFEMMDVLCQYAITFFSLTYVREFVSAWRKKLFTGCQIWTILFAFATTALHIATPLTYADTLPIGAICNVLFIGLDAFAIAWEVFHKRDPETCRLLLSMLSGLLGGLLEIYIYFSRGYTSTSAFFYIGFIIFMLMQLFWYIRLLKEREQQATL